MDFSDLPKSAQDRIAAAEIVADTTAASASASAKQIVETFQFGVDPLGIDLLVYGDSLAVRAAQSELADGRDRAAGHLFGAIAVEYLKAGKLDIEGFNAKLDTIGDWVFQRYRIDRAVLDQMKRECRTAALRKRAAALEAGGTALSTEGPAVSGESNSGTDRRAATDGFILKCKQETSRRITRTDIWRAAGHRSPRQFQFWQASDPKATGQDDQNFRRILAMNPTDFEDLLKRKAII